ncbi:MAG: hypothetical protein EOL93_01885 [Epsilonproteobacteria bacterium]|nr:hypothetical protein [Campylobacterota bacterium]
MDDLQICERHSLSSEELEEIKSEKNGLYQAIKANSPAGKAWLASWRRQKKIDEHVVLMSNQAIIFKQKIENIIKEGVDENGSEWASYPTDLTRCSPFFPMGKQEMAKRIFLEDYVIVSAGWGSIKYTGPKLSIYDEDVLMAVLAIVQSRAKDSGILNEKGKTHYYYNGSVLPILRLLGYENPNKDAYKMVLRSLNLLSVAGVKLSVSVGKKTNSKKEKDQKIIQMASILSTFEWNEKTKDLLVVINPFFYEMYVSKTVTFIDVVKRVNLSGTISKALYRFVQSHRESGVFRGHFLTLADVLNVNLSNQNYEIRRALKKAIIELIDDGILTNKSGFDSQDIIYLERAERTLPGRD